MIVLKDPHTTDNLETGVNLTLAKPDNECLPALYSVLSRQHLDVDEVLARSLPACQAISVSPLRKRIFSWRWRNTLTASPPIKQPGEPVAANASRDFSTD
jgi:hypothetical protein